MKIAVLAWGSLYWDPKQLSVTGDWFFDGPALPIEFARISNGGRLTLVIKPGFDNVTTLYAVSAYDTLDMARENLRLREDTSNITNIAFVNFGDDTKQVRPANEFVIDILREWNRDKEFDAIIWSDFSPRFSDVHQQERFSLENVINYLQSLEEAAKNRALEYIRNAPKQITTRFRNEIEKKFI